MIALARKPKNTRGKRVSPFMPDGVAAPIRGGDGKYHVFCNCDHHPATFVCPQCGLGYSIRYRACEVCMDCATESVYERGAAMQNELGIDLGCGTANIQRMREVFEKPHRAAAARRGARSVAAQGVGDITGYHGHGDGGWVDENSNDDIARRCEERA